MCSDDMADLENYLCLEADICPRSLPPAYVGMDSGHICHTCESIIYTLMFCVLSDSNKLLSYLQGQYDLSSIKHRQTHAMHGDENLNWVPTGELASFQFWPQAESF